LGTQFLCYFRIPCEEDSPMNVVVGERSWLRCVCVVCGGVVERDLDGSEAGEMDCAGVGATRTGVVWCVCFSSIDVTNKIKY